MKIEELDLILRELILPSLFGMVIYFTLLPLLVIMGFMSLITAAITQTLLKIGVNSQ
jgi:hypothetical protein